MFNISRRRKQKYSKRIFIRINNKIRAKEVRLIGSDGKQVGIVATEEALKIAEEEGLDLVEISPKAKPPVCKIMEYGKYIYEKKKKERLAKKKQKNVQLKEIKIRPKTDSHDLEHKGKHAAKFLQQGNKVKVTMMFRGREMVYVNSGKELMFEFFEPLKEFAEIETAPKLEGRTMAMIIAPGKTNK